MQSEAGKPNYEEWLNTINTNSPEGYRAFKEHIINVRQKEGKVHARSEWKQGRAGYSGNVTSPFSISVPVSVERV